MVVVNLDVNCLDVAKVLRELVDVGFDDVVVLLVSYYDDELVCVWVFLFV